MRLPTAAAAAVWLATRTVLLLCVFRVLVVPGPDVTTDVGVIYRGWSQVLGAGTFPEGDVTWQYPPAAALAVLSPALLPFLDYAAAFYVLACAADAGAFVMLLRGARREGARPTGAWCWVAGVPLLGPTAYARYDVMVAVVAVGALLSLPGRPRLAGALAGLGAMLKVWPALLLLGTGRGRVTRAAWTGAAVAVAVLSLGFAVTMPGAFGFLTAQRDRGTEVESLGALVFHVARQFGWEGQVLFHYGSMEFVGPWVPLVSDLAMLLSALAAGWMLMWRLRAVRWTAATPADAAFTAVLLFTATSRVISPQYMVWLVALAAVCLTMRASALRVPAWLMLPATAVTLLEFPVWFVHVVSSDALGLTLLAVRNGLLVVACVLACRGLWRATVPGRRGGDGAEGAVPRARHRRGDGRAPAGRPVPLG
jgi:hypothetical protein